MLEKALRGAAIQGSTTPTNMSMIISKGFNLIFPGFEKDFQKYLINDHTFRPIDLINDHIVSLKLYPFSSLYVMGLFMQYVIKFILVSAEYSAEKATISSVLTNLPILAL